MNASPSLLPNALAARFVLRLLLSLVTVLCSMWACVFFVLSLSFPPAHLPFRQTINVYTKSKKVNNSVCRTKETHKAKKSMSRTPWTHSIDTRHRVDMYVGCEACEKFYTHSGRTRTLSIADVHFVSLCRSFSAWHKTAAFLFCQLSGISTLLRLYVFAWRFLCVCVCVCLLEFIDDAVFRTLNSRLHCRADS